MLIDDFSLIAQRDALCSMMQHMPGKIKSRISVGLSPAALHELTALADEAHVSVSWIGERAIAEFLDRWRDGEIQLPLVLNDNHKRTVR